AAIVALPTNLLAEREGAHLVEDTKQHGIKFPTNVIAVRRGYLQSNPDVVRDYLKAHIEAVELIRRDKALALRLLSKGTDTTDQELLEKVDTETGKVEVTRLHMALYAGRIINPRLCELQVEGSALFGLGQALFEELAVDEQGRLTNPNLSDYMIPSFEDVPR